MQRWVISIKHIHMKKDNKSNAHEQKKCLKKKYHLYYGSLLICTFLYNYSVSAAKYTHFCSFPLQRFLSDVER